MNIGEVEVGVGVRALSFRDGPGGEKGFAEMSGLVAAVRI